MVLLCTNFIRLSLLLCINFIIIYSQCKFPSESNVHWTYINITCNDTIKDYKVKGLHQTSLNNYLYTTNKQKRSINEKANLDETDNYVNKNDSTEHVGPQNQPKDSIQLNDCINDNTSRLYVNIFCNDAVLSESSLKSSSIRSLFLVSSGSLKLETDWHKDVTDMDTLKVSSRHLELPENCTWIPQSLKQLQITGVKIYSSDFSNCVASVQSLTLVESHLRKYNACIPSIEYLDVSSNSLKHFLPMENCSNVEELKLSHNNLKHFSICKMPSLVHVSVDHNYLESLHFGKCPSHKILSIDASHNSIAKLPKHMPSRLSTLVLSFNKIEHTSHIESSLEELYLSHNLLRNITKGTFKSSWQLQKLNLAHNLLCVIKDDYFIGLRQLKYLDISHNSIHLIQYEAFKPLLHLETLKINGNKLHKLDSRLLQSLPKVLHFHAHGNPWKCKCTLIALLNNLIRSTCKSKCKKERDLHCKEGKHTIAASSLLKKCLSAVPKEESVFHYSVKESDEDISEEVTHSSMSLELKSGLIIGSLLILGIVCTKIYYERKFLRNKINTILSKKSSNENGTAQWSSVNNSQLDSESETEF